MSEGRVVSFRLLFFAYLSYLHTTSQEIAAEGFCLLTIPDTRARLLQNVLRRQLLVSPSSQLTKVIEADLGLELP